MKISWFLDDDIDERRDPGKERALPPSVRERTKSASAEPTLLVNYEPLLVNKMGTAHLRPSAGPPASGGIRNMFLASDYVSTFTDLATMEGANEAARRAVNALLDEAKSSEQRCTVVPLREPLQFLRVFDGLMFKIAPRFPWRLGFELAVHALLRPAVCIFAAFNWVVRRF